MEAGHQLRVLRLQLLQQELAQERVIAVPAAVIVDQDRRVRQVPERRRGVRPACHRVTERPAEVLEDRGLHQEGDALSSLALQHLQPQVVADREVSAGHVDTHALAASRRRDRGEHGQGRPAFRPDRDPPDLVAREREPVSLDQLGSFPLVQGELGGPELEHLAPRPPGGNGQLHRLPARDGCPGERRQVADKLREDVVAGAVGDAVRVVDHDEGRCLTLPKTCQEAADGGSGGHAAGRDRGGYVRVDRRHAREGCREIGQQLGGIVTTPVDSQPGHWPFARQLGQNARLAIASRCNQRDDLPVG